jgi:hemerythrin-like domain-containing protein
VLPIERLTREHRLLDRMLAVIESQLARPGDRNTFDLELLDDIIDFMRTYADLIHHGKEEAILFARLAAKPMSDEHRRILADLVADHRKVRERTTLLVAARRLHFRGSSDALAKVADVLRELLAFYPQHVLTEERHFFVPCMEYFSDAERAQMLHDMDEFDRKVFQEQYARLVESLEGRSSGPAG